MAGLTVTLETAKGALLNTQVQIQTASSNISNADSKTYARQKAVLGTNPAMRAFGSWVGTGANVTTIVQMRDQFIEQRLMNSISDENNYGALSSELETIQAVFADDGTTGISQSLGAFYDAWDQLAQNPAGTAQQTTVYQAAQNLAETIRTAYANLDAAATDEIPGMISDTVDQANELMDEIAALNTSIVKNETPDHPANDLRDLRYKAMKELAELVPVSFTEDSTGAVTVTTTDASGSLTLVTGGTVNNPLTTASTITGGRLGGLRTALDDVNGYIDRLNDFAGELIGNVNAIHGQGGGPAVFTGTDAETITASTTFLSGQTPADEASRALAMAGLQGAKITFADGKEATFGQYLADIQQEIGTDAQRAATGETYSQSLRAELETQQQAVSGVSIDEEMVDLLQFQQIYQAAAKVIQKTAEMLNVVMDMVR
ncbi:MAG: flagellar hook-associated protein FlgK [Syntrophobacteraceae bacterium]